MIDATEKITILLIEDNPGDARLIREILSEYGTPFVWIWHTTLSEGLDEIILKEIDVILLDLALPDSWGMDTFYTVRDVAPNLPIIILTGFNDEEMGVLTVKSGAQDYLVKGQFDGHLIWRSIRYAIERNNIERELKESQEQLSLAIEGANLCVWDWNVITGKATVTPGWIESFGYSPGELEGNFNTFLKLIHPDDISAVNKAIEDHHKGYAPFYDVQCRTRSADGRWRWIYIRGKVIECDENGRPLRSIGIFQDITETRKNREALMEAHRRLNFLSSITRHDIINQITGILGYTELLGEIVPEDAQIKDYIGRVMELTTMIQRQITFTRDYEDMGLAEPTWQDIEHLIKGVAETGLLGDIKLDLNVNGVEVYADPILEKVFINLMDNTVRHGETATTLTVGFRTKGGKGILTFEDDGIGIPDEEKEKIFSQAHGRRKGYGLFLVKEILGITGMKIKECGTRGKGVAFEIEIPEGNFRT